MQIQRAPAPCRPLPSPGCRPILPLFQPGGSGPERGQGLEGTRPSKFQPGFDPMPCWPGVMPPSARGDLPQPARTTTWPGMFSLRLLGLLRRLERASVALDGEDPQGRMDAEKVRRALEAPGPVPTLRWRPAGGARTSRKWAGPPCWSRWSWGVMTPAREEGAQALPGFLVEALVPRPLLHRWVRQALERQPSQLKLRPPPSQNWRRSSRFQLKADRRSAMVLPIRSGFGDLCRPSDAQGGSRRPSPAVGGPSSSEGGVPSRLPASPDQATPVGLWGASQRTGQPKGPSMPWPFRRASSSLSTPPIPLSPHRPNHDSAVEQRIKTLGWQQHCRLSS